MASSDVRFNLKLLIDTKENKVLFAEAGKDFVDFLFNLLTLPVGTVIRLLTGKNMVGCLENIYESVKNLNNSYIQPNQSKGALLRPQLATASPAAAKVPLLLADEVSLPKTIYMCGSHGSYGNNHRYVAYDPRAICPQCNSSISNPAMYVAPVVKDASSDEEGFVKGVVTYMIMDDLVVSPMSTISAIALLNKFNISNVGALKEKVVTFGVDEGLKLMNASLQTKTVLSSVFLGILDTTKGNYE